MVVNTKQQNFRLVSTERYIIDDKILDWTKLKAFTNNSNVANTMAFMLCRVDNIVRKGEKAGYQGQILSLGPFLTCHLQMLLTLYSTDTHFEATTIDSF